MCWDLLYGAAVLLGAPYLAWRRLARGKDTITFSDAIPAVRCTLWREWVLARGAHTAAFAKLPRDWQVMLLRALAPAA